MREIRSRISQRHGIELSPQQIQDLAASSARGDPRSAHRQPDACSISFARAPPRRPIALPQSADAGTRLQTMRSTKAAQLLRFFRRLLNPLLKLLFNPAPLVAALQAQARVNRDAAARAVELERRQTEWNALALPDPAAARHRSVANEHRDAVARACASKRSPRGSTSTTAASVRSRTRPPPTRSSQRPQEAAPAPAVHLRASSPVALKAAPASVPAQRRPGR